MKKKLKFKAGDRVLYVNPFYDPEDEGFQSLKRKIVKIKSVEPTNTVYDYVIKHTTTERLFVKEGELAPLTELGRILFEE